MSDLLADCEPMAPLLSAFTRGTKRSRLRQLVVVCPNGHTLAEVFPTTAGPYVVWQERHHERDGEGVMTHENRWHGAPVWREFAAELGVAEARPTDVAAVCGCGAGVGIDGVDLVEWVESGRQRVVHSA